MSENITNLSLWKRLYCMGWKYPLRFISMLLLVAALASLTAYLLIILDQILGFLSESSTQEIAITVAAMKSLALELVMLTPLCAAVAYGAWIQGQWIANRCMLEIRKKFLEHMIELDLSFHSTLARGDLFNRMSGDMERTQGLFHLLFGKLIQQPLEVIGVVSVLLWLNWQITLVIFAALIPLLLILRVTFKKTHKRSKIAREQMADTLVTFEQITSGIRIIKAMGSQETEAQRYSHDNEDLFKANMKVARSRAQADANSNGMAYLSTAIAVFMGAYAYEFANMDPQTLVLFLAATGRISVIARTAQRSFSQALESSASAMRIFSILEQQPAIQDTANAQSCNPDNIHSLTIDGVSFRYTEEAENVLTKLTLEVPIGKSLALVGESGAGKSTILDLIPRFYDVNEGSIRLNDIDIRDYSRASYISLFAIVQQDSFLFNDTVYNNIAYGSPSADQTAVETAAQRANVHQAIIDLEGGLGYQTIVGDRGERLSGGQRQRVAIARALLRDAPILLLDEPTSALDADSEKHVQAALKELMKNRTSIIVAHRLSTIQDADIIVVLDKDSGQIKEHGNHNELMQRDGEYARLVSMQQLKNATE